MVDMRWINLAFEPPKLQYEALHVLRTAPHSAVAAFSLDLTDGSFHLEIAAPLKPYFRFRVNDVTWQIHGMPFGWNCAPFIFTKFMTSVAAAIR